jgi:hypothetical protein
MDCSEKTAKKLNLKQLHINKGLHPHIPISPPHFNKNTNKIKKTLNSGQGMKKKYKKKKLSWKNK